MTFDLSRRRSRISKHGDTDALSDLWVGMVGWVGPPGRLTGPGQYLRETSGNRPWEALARILAKTKLKKILI